MSSPLLLMAPCLAHLSILMPAQSVPEPTDANASIVHVATTVCSDDDSGAGRALVVTYPDGTIEAAQVDTPAH